MIDVNIYYYREYSCDPWHYWIVDINKNKIIRDGQLLSGYNQVWLFKSLLSNFEFYCRFKCNLVSIINENYKEK